jgi:hypothetical protein
MVRLQPCFLLVRGCMHTYHEQCLSEKNDKGERAAEGAHEDYQDLYLDINPGPTTEVCISLQEVSR